MLDTQSETPVVHSYDEQDALNEVHEDEVAGRQAEAQEQIYLEFLSRRKAARGY